MNTMPKDVTTTMLPELGGQATALTGDVAAAVTDLKKVPAARSSLRVAPR